MGGENERFAAYSVAHAVNASIARAVSALAPFSTRRIEREILSAEAGSHTHTLRTRGVRTSHAHKPLRQANCLDTAAACRPTPRARTVPPSAPILRVPNIRGQSYTSSGVARRARRRA